MSTLIGKEFGRYQILSLLGHGGMSEVFQAEHLLMKRMVALKVISFADEDFPAEAAIQRFQKESQLLGSLHHPNIVDVFDFGFEHGCAFMVMELIAGASLRSILQDAHHLDITESLKIFIQICHALEHAHAHGMIHRDLKPGNVMVEPDGVVKLLDFGVAKLLRATDFDLQIETEDDFMMGTPPYLSPEQCQGLKLDARSDIYSLGCLMYETLSGHLPILGRNSMETVQKHLRYTPPRFKQVAPDLQLPPGAELVTMKCLEKHRGDRYQSALELRQDLERLAENKPLQALNVDCALLKKPESSHSDWFAAPGGSSVEIIDRLEEIKSFAYSSFDRVDANSDGFITEEELRTAIMDEATPWRQKSYLSFLLRRIGEVQSSYNEEWSPANAGISRADIQEYFSIIKQTLTSSEPA